MTEAIINELRDARWHGTAWHDLAHRAAAALRAAEQERDDALRAIADEREACAKVADEFAAAAKKPKSRPTIAELEAILAADSGPPIHLNPDGSIGVGPPTVADEIAQAIRARSLLSPTEVEKRDG